MESESIEAMSPPWSASEASEPATPVYASDGLTTSSITDDLSTHRVLFHHWAQNYDKAESGWCVLKTQSSESGDEQTEGEKTQVSAKQETEQKKTVEESMTDESDTTQTSLTSEDIEASEEETKLAEAYFYRLPRAYMYADYIWPGLLMSPARHAALAEMEFGPEDILICSYPKSGTTWVSEIISLIVNNGDIQAVKDKPLHERVPWLEMENGYVWVQAFWLWQLLAKALGFKKDEDDDAKDANSPAPRVLFTHLPIELLPPSALEAQCKIVYVARNPKDNAVSFFHFHQIARYLGQQQIEWADFFPLYLSGKIYCGSWFEHVKGFWNLSKAKSNVLFLKYEDLKKDLVGEVGKLSTFLGRKLSEETVTTVAEHCHFGAMKDNRMVNREGVWLFNQRVSRFMRKGEVGDWVNYFTVAQSALFDDSYDARMADVPDLTFDFLPIIQSTQIPSHTHPQEQTTIS